jgi:nitronate monooxygenase
LACATLDPDALQALIVSARGVDGTSFGGPINANFFAHPRGAESDDRDRRWLERLAPYYERIDARPPEQLGAGPVRSFDEASCDVVVAAGVEIVSFHFGLPAPELVERLKTNGSIVMSSATTVEEARWLENRGCDVIIAQGSEAGGHRGTFLGGRVDGQLGTLALVPQVVDAVDVPVVAAGGIGDGRGVAAAFALGASGVQVGTAFLSTHEASITELHREALSGAATLGTAITNVFSGRPARCVTNRVMAEVGAMAEEAAGFPQGFSAMAPLRKQAEAEQSRDFSAHYCGQSAPLSAHAPASSAEVLQRLVDGAQRTWSRRGAGGLSRTRAR